MEVDRVPAPQPRHCSWAEGSLTAPAASAPPWFPRHTPGSSGGTEAGSVFPSKESESRTALNRKLPDSPKNGKKESKVMICLLGEKYVREDSDFIYEGNSFYGFVLMHTDHTSNLCVSG